MRTPTFTTDVYHFDSQLLQAGTFFCPPTYPNFHNTGPIQGWLIVFPRTSVVIRPEGRDPFVANPNTVVFYNRGQSYERELVSSEGDLCDWFSFAPEVVTGLVAEFDDTVFHRESTPFCFSHAPCSPTVYARQRLIVHEVAGSDAFCRMQIQEQILMLLEMVIASAFAQQGQRVRRAESTRSAHRRLANDAAAYLATHFKEPLSVASVAKAMASSPYHLCRVFKRETGRSLHQHLTQLRLRASLAALAEHSPDLATVGLDYGFASHSHFSAAFNRAFGMTPSQFRHDATPARQLEMSKILTA